ncbi:MAG: hypothetical protein ACI9R3_006351 [Verrucomicrobiales bacterium]|jgi:hypothetical protein
MPHGWSANDSSTQSKQKREDGFVPRLLNFFVPHPVKDSITISISTLYVVNGEVGVIFSNLYLEVFAGHLALLH